MIGVSWSSSPKVVQLTGCHRSHSFYTGLTIISSSSLLVSASAINLTHCLMPTPRYVCTCVCVRYLETVYPELEVPESRGRQPGGLLPPGAGHDRTVASVRLRLAGTDLCLQTAEEGGPRLRRCSEQHPDQVRRTVELDYHGLIM